MSLPSADQLKRALAISEKIAALEAELSSILGKGGRGKAASSPKKRMMSPEARERIAAAQRLRWSKVKREKKKTEKAGQ